MIESQIQTRSARASGRHLTIALNLAWNAGQQLTAASPSMALRSGAGSPIHESSILGDGCQELPATCLDRILLPAPSNTQT